MGTNPAGLAVADLNGDGKLHLVVANQNCHNASGPCLPGTVSVLLGKGDGTFEPRRDFAAGVGPNGLAVGDFKPANLWGVETVLIVQVLYLKTSSSRPPGLPHSGPR